MVRIHFPGMRAVGSIQKGNTMNMRKYRPGQIVKIGSVLPHPVKIDGPPQIDHTFNRTLIPVQSPRYGFQFITPNQIRQS